MNKTEYQLFSKRTQAIIFNLQVNAIQRMLDFDFVCNRETPSVAAIVNPNAKKGGFHKTFWGTREILIPIYQNIQLAAATHKQADVVINFSSFRSAYGTSVEALNEETIRTVVIIAEGVPERRAREIAALAKSMGKVVIGPATVGGIFAGGFKIANTGGTIDNILSSKLNRPGSVAFVSKSGGMSNEAYNIIAQGTDGLYEGVAIGGDSYPGSTLLDHILRYEANPQVKMIVVLGEVGGTEEYKIVDAIKEGIIKKPMVCWVTGTIASKMKGEVQFGHAGAKAGSDRETADAKNAALKEVGVIVPNSFDDYGEKIETTFKKLLEAGKIEEKEEPSIPPIPTDYKKLQAEGTVRKPTGFICTITDDRGGEPLYAGVPMSKVIENDMRIGEMIGLLWFKKKLPPYASEFIDIVLRLTADHGPCVSGAHNTIVTARAGRDLMSAVASGILTIGPRFGGAVSGAAKMFSQAKKENLSPLEFIKDMKAKGINIQGIGHRIKSASNPDIRVTLLKKFARENFPVTPHLDYALEVEKITLTKRNNLILNVDGCIGILFLDLMDAAGDLFSPEEKADIIEYGILNGLFMLGRTIGMIGHYFDQKRLKSGLYRHPMDDVLYDLPSNEDLGYDFT
jgi:succinyl-CoA synthetase alpha subunit/citrate synthase